MRVHPVSRSKSGGRDGHHWRGRPNRARPARHRARLRAVGLSRRLRGSGVWVCPGGEVDRGEEITVAAIREAREEAGLHVRLDGLINIYSYPGRPIIIVVYRASIVGGGLGGG